MLDGCALVTDIARDVSAACSADQDQQRRACESRRAASETAKEWQQGEMCPVDLSLRLNAVG